MENKKCVIYTRVSSLSQYRENHSIDAQLNNCLAFAKKEKFTEIKEMGGVPESAKDAVRESFNQMLDYVLDKRNNVSSVIINSVDRFSRNITLGTKDVDRLVQKGITLYSVMENVNSADKNGLFVIYLLLNLAQLDNSNRSDRTKMGIRNQALQGEFPYAKPPRGYNKNLEPNEQGELIKKAFKMLLNGYRPTSIQKYMTALDFNLDLKRWSEIFRNKFYAGCISVKIDEKERLYVKGKHTPLISEEEFTEVQKILSKNNKARVKETQEVECYPLKTLISCCNCGGTMTAYVAQQKKNKPAYYKCNNKGCNYNISANNVNGKYLGILAKLQLNPILSTKVGIYFEEAFEDFFKTELNKKRRLLQAINTKESALTKMLKDKYTTSNIPSERFELLYKELTEEKSNLEKELSQCSQCIPDKDLFINDCISNLSIDELWKNIEYCDKQNLFRLIFKESISVSKNNREVSIENIKLNPAFRLIA